MSLAIISTTELIIVLVILLLLFGAAKLPKLARSIGQAQKEFRKSSEETGEASGGGETPSEDNKASSEGKTPAKKT